MDNPLAIVAFYAMASALVLLSLATVLWRNVFRSALALTGALAVMAGFFAMLGADFLAGGQLLIYVGGIMIIMLFVVMLSQQPLERLSRQTNQQWLLGALVAVGLGGTLWGQFKTAYRMLSEMPTPSPTTAPLGRLLLGDMAVPFEVVSLVLLTALVGAVFFSEKLGRGRD